MNNPFHADYDGLTRLFDTFFNGRPAPGALEELARQARQLPPRDHDYPTVSVALVQYGRTLVRCNGKAYKIVVTEVEITK